MATFGENLRALRKSRGLSQERLAELIDSTQAAITTWERQTRVPNLAMITHIADVFQVPVSSLIGIENSGVEEDYVQQVADTLQHNPKIKLLFDKTRYMSPQDLDAVLSVVNAITRERVENE